MEVLSDADGDLKNIKRTLNGMLMAFSFFLDGIWLSHEKLCFRGRDKNWTINLEHGLNKRLAGVSHKTPRVPMQTSIHHSIKFKNWLTQVDYRWL